jgi:hypothetical protein
MGTEIVYCSSCQIRILGGDFQKGTALRIEGQAYCAKCAPEKIKSLPPEKTREIPPPTRPRKTSTARIPLPDRTPAYGTRPAAAEAPRSNKGLLIGVAGGSGILLLILLALALRKGPSRDVESSPTKAPESIKPSGGEPGRAGAATAPVEKPEEVIARLERAASTEQDPTSILLRCEEARMSLRGTPIENRLREIEAAAAERKKAGEGARQVEAALEQVRRSRKDDPGFHRRQDLLALLRATLDMAGPRRDEVRKVLEEYEKESLEGLARFKGLEAWYRFASQAELGKDASGKGQDATSVHGVTWAGGAARFAGDGCIAVPLAIRDDFTIAFRVQTMQAAPDGDHWFRGIGLVDAEVGGETSDFGTALMGPKFVFGAGAPAATIRSKTRVTDGLWHFVAATRDGRSGQMKLYVDGVLEADAVGPAGTRLAPRRLTLGRIQTDCNFFAGSLGDVRLYSRVLAEDEIRFLSRDGAPK